jgi:restriction endonuclease Mrr
MAPVIRISDDLFKELQKLAEPLVDNVEDIIWKLIKKKKPGARSQDGLNQRFARDILKLLHDLGSLSSSKVLAELERRLGSQLTSDDRKQEPSGQIAWRHRIHATKFNLKKDGLLEDVQRGEWGITKKGLECLRS